jgi:DNA-binding NarL/FixJ family response regulator
MQFKRRSRKEVVRVDVQKRRYIMMKIIKVLLSSRPKLLSEVIRNLIEHQADMEVVGEVLDPLQLLRFSRQILVDVIIITPLRANGEPKICHLLLAEHPRLKIVTQSASGEVAYLYQSGQLKKRIDEPSGQAILDVIRETVQPSVN